MIMKGINSAIIRQYVAVISVNISVLGVGMALAWSSPMLVKLRDTTNPVLGRPITDEEGSWLVSVGFLIGPILNFTPIILVDKIGRKKSIYVALIPKAIGSLLMLFASKVWILILGRAISGVTDMFIFTVVPTYASEIASKEIRGALNTILQIMCSLGVVFMLCVGPFISYLAVNAIYAIVVIAALLPIPFLPESPYFLYIKGRQDESLKVIKLFYGSEAAAKEKLNEYTIANTEERVNKLELLKSRVFWKSLSMVIVLLVGAQLLGFHAVSFYLQTILESTGTSVKPEIASMIIGIIQLIASVFTTATTDKFGRKPIMSTNLLGLMIGMICLGYFFYVTENAGNIVGFMNFLPLLAIALIVFCFNAGSGSLNWSLSVELFDNKGRTFGLSVGLMLSGLTTFFVSKYFPFVMIALGPVITYAFFSVNCLLLCIFVLIFIPETKGKSYNEIQRGLGAKLPSENKHMETELHTRV